jgi:hypothetical protein
MHYNFLNNIQHWYFVAHCPEYKSFVFPQGFSIL